MKHFYIILLISLLIGIEMEAQTIASGFAGGTGTEQDPYQIANIEQLRFLAQQCNRGVSYKGKFIVLTANVRDNNKVLNSDGDLAVPQNTLREWIPIGLNKESPFMGSFDGQGFSISGIFGSRENQTCIFGFVSDCKFSNVCIRDSYHYSFVYGWSNSNVNFYNCINYASAVYGISIGCHTSPSRNYNFYDCGNYGKCVQAGIADGATKIINCYNYGQIEPTNYSCGGVVNYASSIQNCLNAGTILNNIDERIGGVVRWVENGRDGLVNNCVNYGQIEPFNSNGCAIIATCGSNMNVKQTANNIYWLETSCIRGYSENLYLHCKLNNVNKLDEDEMKSSQILDELNNNSRSINGACGWKKGKNGFPILDIIDEESNNNGVENVFTDPSENLPIKYYNLNGIEIQNPSHGIFIKVQGGKREKIIL